MLRSSAASLLVSIGLRSVKGIFIVRITPSNQPSSSPMQDTVMASIAPEIELLLCCARSIVEPNIAERIRILAQERIDWTCLAQLSTYHGLTSLVYDNLYNTLPKDYPQAVLAELQIPALSYVKRSAFLTQQLIHLLNFFAAYDLPVIPYKGPALAISCYQNPMLRVFHDLDILVHKWDYHFTIDHLLTSHNWRLCSDYGWEKGFVDINEQVVLDVHASITHRNLPFRLNFNRVWKRCVTVSVAGHQVKTFAPDDLLIVLCVQIAKDVAGNKIQLSKICDLAELIRSHQDIDWEEVLRESRRLGVQTILYLSLHTATSLLGAPVPKEILKKGHSIKNLEALLIHIRECIIGAPKHGYHYPELLNESRFYSEVHCTRQNSEHRIWLINMVFWPCEGIA